MTNSTSISPSSPVNSRRTSLTGTAPTSTKPFPRRSSATGASKFRSSAGLFSEQWRLGASDEVRKAREQVLGYKATARYVSAQQRAQRCQSLVSEALSVMTDEEADFAPSSAPLAPPSPPLATSQSPASVDLGYGNDSDLGYGYRRSNSDPTSLGSKDRFGSGNRRYQRRCSVTEFSLKAAVLAKVQMERQNRR